MQILLILCQNLIHFPVLEQKDVLSMKDQDSQQKHKLAGFVPWTNIAGELGEGKKEQEVRCY